MYIFKPLCESQIEVLANFSLNISAKIFIFTIFSIILQVYLSKSKVINSLEENSKKIVKIFSTNLFVVINAMIYGTLIMISEAFTWKLVVVIIGVIFVCIVNRVRTKEIDERLSKISTYFMLFIVISFLLVGPFIMYF